MSETISETTLFEDNFEKPLFFQFDSAQRTSDGGSPLLGVVDRRIGLTEKLCGELIDRRDPARIEHSHLSMFRQRVFGIALGYPDGNDSARIGGDPAMKLLCGRGPADDGALASQPSLSRFENGLGGREVVKLGRKLEEVVIDRLKERHGDARVVTIDLDPSVDPTHGQQPFSFFHGYYDSWCYLPMFGFLSVDGNPEQHLFHARLRPGLSKEVHGTIALLIRTVKRLRRTFKRARIRVRLDAGFACPQLFEALDDLRVEYLVAMPENEVLARKSSMYMRAAGSLAGQFNRSMALFGECRYETQSWNRERRVIFKAEVVCASGKSPRRNARYVVTNLRGKPERVWKTYCKRGDSENRIKELKRDLDVDRTSCSSFLANQVRVLMAATAFVLFQELRASLPDADLKRSMVGTLRMRLLKIGATITESVRRIVISLPASYPWKERWRRAAACVAVMA